MNEHVCVYTVDGDLIIVHNLASYPPIPNRPQLFYIVCLSDCVGNWLVAGLLGGPGELHHTTQS